MKNGNSRVKKGTIIGHEIVGYVEKKGKYVNKFNKGDLLSFGADIPCGNCNYCKKR